MNSRIKLSVRFFQKNNRVSQDGKSAVYARITYDKQRIEISTKRNIDCSKWSNSLQKVNGTNPVVKDINQFFESFKNTIYNAHSELVKERKEITVFAIKDRALGLDVNQAQGLIELMDYHHAYISRLKGSDYAPGTIIRYETLKRLVLEFLRVKLNKTEVSLEDLDHRFVLEFDLYLKTVRKNANNTATKYLKNLKSILNFGRQNDWTENDPFKKVKFRLETVTRQCLTMEEIKQIENHHFTNERIQVIKDIFLFCCYTGLCYVDVLKMSKDNLCVGIDSNQWLVFSRTKTNVEVKMPLHRIPLELIEKYKNHPTVVVKNVLFPVLSNQKMNAYLKEIADICGITKNLTMHIARHTFATTITLTNGMPIETVSKLLGHTKLSTTQHYSKVVDVKIVEEMDKVWSRIG